MGALAASRVVHLCGAASAAAWASLAIASPDRPVPLPLFLGVVAVAWLALAVAWWRTRTSAPLPLAAVLSWALVFRLLGLFAEPVLEDDHYRYLWDGRATAVLGTPYGHAPEDFFDDASLGPVFEGVLDRINNPDVPTLYPPAAQLLFALGYGVAPGAFLPIKLLLLGADLLTLALLARWPTPRGAMLYAWCPLLVHEVSFNGHVDALGVFALVAAAAASRRVRRGALAWAAVGALAALAVGTKAVAVLLLPPLAARLPLRGMPVAAAAFGLVLAGLYAPFALPLLAGSAAPGTDLAGLFVFASEWEFNSTAFALLSAWGGRDAALLCGGLATLAAVLAAVRRARRDSGEALPRGEWIVGATLLFAPVVNPWYLLWLAPFAAARPAPWAVAALAVVPVSYCHGLFLSGSLPAYHHPVWVRPLELGVVAGALVLSLFVSRPRRDGRQGDGTVSRGSSGGLSHRPAFRSAGLCARLARLVRSARVGDVHGQAQQAERLRRPLELRARQEGVRG